MKKVQLYFLYFLTVLVIFFNIERLDVSGENLINIDTFVYFLTFFAVASVVTIPFLHRASIWISLWIWFVIYLVSKFVALSWGGHPLIGGSYIYISITEAFLLVLTVGLAHRLFSALSDLEKAMEGSFTLPTNKRILSLKEAEEDIAIEMFRSRHSHHPLSIVIVEPKPESIESALHQIAREVQRAMMKSHVINNMAQVLSNYLRRPDMILEQRENGRFIVVCPDTSSSDLKLLVDYIQSVVSEEVDISVTCGIATFPDEALTFEELLLEAEKRLKQSRNTDSSGENIAEEAASFPELAKKPR